MSSLQLGADFQLTPEIIAGLSVGLTNFSNSAEGYTVDGSEWVLQPYVGLEYGSWYGTASLFYGQQDYDSIEFLGEEASAKGKLLAVSIEAARDFEIGYNLTLTPSAFAGLGVVKITEGNDALENIGVDETVNFKEFSLGADVAKPFGPGLIIAGISADYFDTDAPIALRSGEFDQTGISGSATLGYQAVFGNGLNLDAKLRAGGLGSDQQDYSGSLQIGYFF